MQRNAVECRADVAKKKRKKKRSKMMQRRVIQSNTANLISEIDFVTTSLHLKELQEFT